ncbi:hypothetical protein BX616_006802 [Lobosporangium transversale]|uniref:Uncharacterized protein n=1 Tax=Lobosporangium transversale TaxID=64571 RepID=A0A1Y2G6Q0_9FUNG|nr:hypothetical protein BCR41DRAFT_426986 [Lobosporangium transversale]XP_021875184.1 hypothetical protein BCR41DRAFT_390916 [Lobosporangium transversale]KAF9896765.1 hypothetical protein BX616_006802 [Lobosporangium transversale]ORY93688.1 hypothetical protein BCR41DRAFT_426986 [Lobosporangium transversale]ORY93689.1 hypothetical protein BCR41DRAFT_390916 [Lobosporangium transversale]|eukprot:XP_021875183.1 hypothetical protein BCR41DRAFT_426986 [Lobosporangium transversale]
MPSLSKILSIAVVALVPLLQLNQVVEAAPRGGIVHPLPEIKVNSANPPAQFDEGGSPHLAQNGTNREVSAYATAMPSASNVRFWEDQKHQGRCAKCKNFAYNTCYGIDMSKFGIGRVSAFWFEQFDTRNGYTSLTLYDGTQCDGSWFRYSYDQNTRSYGVGYLGDYNDKIRSFKIADFYVAPGTGSNQPKDPSVNNNSCYRGNNDECANSL